MRNRHYEMSFHTFHTLQNMIHNEGKFSLEDHFPYLEQFSNELETTLHYAREATSPANRKRIPQYRFDKEYGILQEEIILVHFLEEMNSSLRYLLNRIDTDQNLRDFEEQLQEYKAQREKGGSSADGFVTNVLASLSNLRENDQTKFNEVFPVLERRYQVGNQLFSLIRELQTFPGANH